MWMSALVFNVSYSLLFSWKSLHKDSRESTMHSLVHSLLFALPLTCRRPLQVLGQAREDQWIHYYTFIFAEPTGPSRIQIELHKYPVNQ